uniref:Uncharacterized protein n=1 Tax=Phaeomonas parva TaxID=124430 RepID=A0A7S1U667_9STRA|mmetsp:Transcript_33551/g.106005  ORF Transcript_33551/g.106005 Transcript_33551/m.106005 type:complete len:377 (+) Transcript_33551:144-1274(+)
MLRRLRAVAATQAHNISARGRAPPLLVVALAVIVGRFLGLRILPGRGCQEHYVSPAELDLTWMSAGHDAYLLQERAREDLSGTDAEKLKAYVLQTQRLFGDYAAMPDNVARARDGDPNRDDAYGVRLKGVPPAELELVEDETCFVTASCVRRYHCVSPMAGDGAACMDFFRAPSNAGANAEILEESGSGLGRCVAYSFAFTKTLDWEARMLREAPCDVYYFNPEMDAITYSALVMEAGLTAEQAARLFFQPLGFQGMYPEPRNPGPNPKELPLSSIRERLGHGNRPVSFTRIDCAGCEFAADDMDEMLLSQTRQLSIGYDKSRIPRGLHPSPEARVRRAFQQLRRVAAEQGFELFRADAAPPPGAGVTLTLISPRW